MRRSVLIILFFISALISNGQDKFTKALYIGAKGGITESQVRFYPTIPQAFFQGNTGGLFFRMISEPHIGIQVEANYIQKGWQEEPLVSDPSKSYFHQLNYLDFPVMTHVNFGKKAIRVILNLGPSISFLMSEEQGLKPSGTIPANSEEAQEYWGKPIDSNIDFLFTVGIGMEYHLKGGSAFSLESRVYYSLPNIFDPDNYSYKLSQSNGAQLTLAYLFQINRKQK
jgi:hypothetical protein